MIKFAMFDDGTIREWKYRGVLLFKTSKHRAFTRRIREEFIEEVATLQEHNAELEAKAETLNTCDIKSLYVRRNADSGSWRVGESGCDNDKVGQGNTFFAAVYDWKHKNLPKPEPKPTAEELLRRVNISHHDGITEDDYDDLKHDIDTYFADRDREAGDE